MMITALFVAIILEENCLYTAAAHHIIAADLEAKARWFKYVPIAGSVVSGALLAMGLPQWLGWVALASGVATAWATAMDVERRAREHGEATRRYTILKHEARAAFQTFAYEVTREEFYRETRRLAERYNQVMSATPVTTNDAFEKARARIKAGRYVPDFMEQADHGPSPQQSARTETA